MDTAVREIDMEAYNTQIRPFAFALSGQVVLVLPYTHGGCQIGSPFVFAFCSSVSLPPFPRVYFCCSSFVVA